MFGFWIARYCFCFKSGAVTGLSSNINYCSRKSPSRWSCNDSAYHCRLWQWLSRESVWTQFFPPWYTLLPAGLSAGFDKSKTATVRAHTHKHAHTHRRTHTETGMLDRRGWRDASQLSPPSSLITDRDTFFFFSKRSYEHSLLHLSPDVCRLL